MVFKSSHWGALDYHLLTDHHCPWLSVIHFTCFSSPDIRSSMTLGFYFSECTLFFFRLVLSALTSRCGAVSQFMQRAEVDGLSRRRLLSGRGAGWHSLGSHFPKGGVSKSAGWMCKWVHVWSVLLTSWFWCHAASWMRGAAAGLKVSGVLPQWSNTKTGSETLFCRLDFLAMFFFFDNLSSHNVSESFWQCYNMSTYFFFIPHPGVCGNVWTSTYAWMQKAF